MTTTTHIGSFGSYARYNEPADVVAEYLGDQGGSFDAAAIASDFRDAINAALDSAGIRMAGREFYGTVPVADDAADLIHAAIDDVDLAAICAQHEIATPTTSAEWADALDAEQRNHADAGDMVSHGFAQGALCGIPLDPEADDDYSRRLVSADGRMVVRYDEQQGYWMAED